MAEKKKIGCPLKFKNRKKLQESIDAYFAHCDATEIKKILNKNQEIISVVTKPYTITGLAYWLGTNRQTLINYENRDEFFDTIKAAKAKIEACYEEKGLVGDSVPAVSIFCLKNNFGWKDKSEHDLSTLGKPIQQNVFVVPAFDNSVEAPEDNSDSGNNDGGDE